MQQLRQSKDLPQMSVVELGPGQYHPLPRGGTDPLQQWFLIS